MRLVCLLGVYVTVFSNIRIVVIERMYRICYILNSHHTIRIRTSDTSIINYIVLVFGFQYYSNTTAVILVCDRDLSG